MRRVILQEKVWSCFLGLNSVASVATYSPDTSIIFPNRRAIALTKMLTVNDVLQVKDFYIFSCVHMLIQIFFQMPALLNSHVHMNDKNQVAAKIFEIVRGKHEKLQVVLLHKSLETIHQLKCIPFLDYH